MDSCNWLYGVRQGSFSSTALLPHCRWRNPEKNGVKITLSSRQNDVATSFWHKTTLFLRHVSVGNLNKAWERCVYSMDGKEDTQRKALGAKDHLAEQMTTNRPTRAYLQLKNIPRFCFVLFCFRYIKVPNVFIWFIYPYFSEVRHWYCVWLLPTPVK